MEILSYVLYTERGILGILFLISISRRCQAEIVIWKLRAVVSQNIIMTAWAIVDLGLYVWN